MSKERERYDAIARAVRCGLTEADAVAIRRIALTLHRWFELECGYGTNHGSWAIERDEASNIPYMVCHINGHGQRPDQTIKSRIADRETSARKRLDRIMTNYPHLRAWIQTDPRGGTIYLCKPEDATDSLYSQGTFIA